MTDERLMTLAEVAKYLHMGDRTVLKLAQAGKIPALQIETQWRFRKGDLDVWLESQLRTEHAFEDVPDGMRLPLGDIMLMEGIISDLRAGDALGVIEELAARAYGNRWLKDKPWFVGAVVERESLSSTAMEGGVAFLHTRAKDHGKIARPFIIVGRSYDGIDFGAPDSERTHLFFLLGLKYDKIHLPILGRLARVLKNPAVVSKVRATTSPTKIRSTLLAEDLKAIKGEAVVPDFPQGPVLDREVRKRAIMRVALRKRDAEKKEKKASKVATATAKKAAATAKKAAATAKKAAPATKKAAAAKAPGAVVRRPAAKKPAAKKPAAATAKKATSVAKKPAAKKAATPKK